MFLFNLVYIYEAISAITSIDVGSKKVAGDEIGSRFINSTLNNVSIERNKFLYFEIETRRKRTGDSAVTAARHQHNAAAFRRFGTGGFDGHSRAHLPGVSLATSRSQELLYQQNVDKESREIVIRRQDDPSKGGRTNQHHQPSADGQFRLDHRPYDVHHGRRNDSGRHSESHVVPRHEAGPYGKRRKRSPIGRLRFPTQRHRRYGNLADGNHHRLQRFFFILNI